MTLTLYHNPRCSKSRQALALLEERNVELTIVPYLEEPLSSEELKTLAKQLGMSPRDFIRTGEDTYKALNLGDNELSDDELFSAMAKHPKLVERPIGVLKGKAKLGRPPENILDLLD